MSRASKIFLGSSMLISGFTVWGVHFLQERESNTMYQGVLRDEARLRDKALSAAQSAMSSLVPSALTAEGSSSSSTPLNTPSSPSRAPGTVIPSNPQSSSGNGTGSIPSSSSPVMQPQAVMDEDCDTCRISPPPQLLESQSKEQRRVERELRELEYRQQRDLAGRLGKEQGVHSGSEGVGAGRLV